MAPPNRAQAAMSPEQVNAMREQQVVNGRILAMKTAKNILSIQALGPVTADKLIEEAKKIEAYLVGDLQSLKPRSGLVVTGHMPPAGAGFKPGD